jgi:hypothetical protein
MLIILLTESNCQWFRRERGRKKIHGEKDKLKIVLDKKLPSPYNMNERSFINMN